MTNGRADGVVANLSAANNNNKRMVRIRAPDCLVPASCVVIAKLYIVLVVACPCCRRLGRLTYRQTGTFATGGSRNGTQSIEQSLGKVPAGST